MVPGFSVLMATRVVPFQVPNQTCAHYLLSLLPDMLNNELSYNTPKIQESH